MTGRHLDLPTFCFITENPPGCRPLAAPSFSFSSISAITLTTACLYPAPVNVALGRLSTKLVEAVTCLANLVWQRSTAFLSGAASPLVDAWLVGPFFVGAAGPLDDAESSTSKSLSSQSSKLGCAPPDDEGEAGAIALGTFHLAAWYG